jgi:hypothetical protein
MRTALVLTAVIAGVLICAPLAEAALGGYYSYWQGDDLDSGNGVGGRATILHLAIVEVDARISVLRFDKPGVTAVPIELAGYASLGVFYGGLGVGYYIFDEKIVDSGGTFVLLGAKVALMGFGFFAETNYRFIQPTVNNVEIDASGVGASFGVLLGF